MRSMFADQPYSEVVKTQGESAMREEMMTFSTCAAAPCRRRVGGCWVASCCFVWGKDLLVLGEEMVLDGETIKWDGQLR